MAGAGPYALSQRFSEVGRLTLEGWLTPRLDWDGLHRWPGTEVVEARSAGPDGNIEIRLSNSERLAVDYVVFASGYRADLARVPYLAGVLGRIERADGFPVLDEAFRTTLPASTSRASRPRGTSARSSAS